MVTVADALIEMNLDADEGERCIATIDDGKTTHFRADQIAARDVSTVGGNVYTTVARYAPGSLRNNKGRAASNAVAVDALIFDADLKDYLGMPKEELHQKEHEELDAFTQSLVKDAQETFRLVGVPIHQIVSTGYGIALHVRIHPDDQRRIDDIVHLQRELVRRLNERFGGILVDPQVADPASRLTRVVGSFNHKGSQPRPVRSLFLAPGRIRLADFPTEPAAPRLPVALPPERELSADTADEVVLAVANEYGEGNRHAISLGLTALMLKSGVPGDQVIDVIERLAHDDEERNDRLRAVRDTIARFESGLSIAGYTALANQMRPSILDYVDARLNPRPTIRVPQNGEPEEETLFHETFGRSYDPPPRECYYGWFGDYLRLVENTTSGPDQFHLASALVYAGATLGRRFHAYHARWNVYPNLMVVIIGDSGTAHKDTCIQGARELFNLQANPDDTEMRPMPYSYLSSLSTPEGLIDHLNKIEPTARLVVYVREFNSLLLKARREVGGGMLPLLQDLWDSPDQVDVPTRKDPLTVAHPCVSLIGSVTPTVLARDANVYDIEGGFANRLLWIYGSGKGFIADPPEADRREERRLIREFLRAVESYGVSEGSIRINKDPAAALLWDAWSMSHHAHGFLNEDEVNLTARVQNNALRIALIYAVSEGSRVITERHLDAATKFVDWSLGHIKREVRLWGSDDGARLQGRILSLLSRGPLSRKEIFGQLERYSVGTLKKTLDDMQWMELIHIPKPDGKYALT